jgi:8-oxo-dGTP pyrophosphatase MutT (NUDIX family)
MNRELPEWLAARLSQPLPGPMVGSRFEPRPRPWRHYDVAPREARPAAVLLLLYPHEDRWHLPLTLRPTHLGAHAGQVSLPGGAVEPGETTAAAALREFHEELGDDGQPIDLLGALSPLYVEASNYVVAPWVAVAPSRPRFVANPEEVEEVLEVPLAHLLGPAHFGSHVRQHQDRDYDAPHFLCQSHRIWGATCMILGEFVTVLEGSGIVD